MISFKKKYRFLDIIILSIILSLINFKDFYLSCVNYLNLGFDSQIPLVWDYTVLNKLLPYRDIYFPYGLLFYLKNTDPFMSVVYFLVPVLIFVGIYIILKYLFKNIFVALVSFISFYLFIFKYTGIENFARYGIVLGVSLLLSYIFHKRPIIDVKASVLLGLLIGVVFSLVNDQGVYSFLLFIFLLVFIPLFNKFKNMNYLKYFISRLMSAGLGLIIGLLPMLTFLNAHNLTKKFYVFLVQLFDFPLYAKTPFIPFSTSVDNLFTFAAIFITIVLLSYRVFFTRIKISFVTVLELSLVFVIFILEQKSIIRSIDKQITFIAFFLYIVLFYDFIKNKLNNFFVLLSLVAVPLLIQFGFGLHSFINYGLNFNQKLMSSFLNKNIGDFLHSKSKLCLDNNLDNLMLERNVAFEKVKKMIKDDSGGNPKIFDYLSDPVFYVLFDQKPPYYFTVFEATPLYSQRSNIDYIRKNRVNYVIKNTNLQVIEDGVPDNVRNRDLFKYVENNFKVLGRINNFTIYKKI